MGYVGSHGYHELIGIDANEPVPDDLSGFALPSRVSGEFPGTGSQARRFQPDRSTFLQERRRQIRRWRIPGRGSRVGDSNYNALQVDLNHRFSHDLSFAAFTPGPRRWMMATR